jgi:hypothetical protein
MFVGYGLEHQTVKRLIHMVGVAMALLNLVGMLTPSGLRAVYSSRLGVIAFARFPFGEGGDES